LSWKVVRRSGGNSNFEMTLRVIYLELAKANPVLRLLYFARTIVGTAQEQDRNENVGHVVGLQRHTNQRRVALQSGQERTQYSFSLDGHQGGATERRLDENFCRLSWSITFFVGLEGKLHIVAIIPA